MDVVGACRPEPGSPPVRPTPAWSSTPTPGQPPLPLPDFRVKNHPPSHIVGVKLCLGVVPGGCWCSELVN